MQVVALSPPFRAALWLPFFYAHYIAVRLLFIVKQ